MKKKTIKTTKGQKKEKIGEKNPVDNKCKTRRNKKNKEVNYLKENWRCKACDGRYNSKVARK